MYLNIKTEFSFRSVYGKVGDIAKMASKGSKFAGIADSNSFGFVKWEKACIANGINPIFSISIPVVVELQREHRRSCFNTMTFVALKNKGIKELFKLIKLSHDQFYYRPRLTYKQVSKIPKSVLILSGFAPKLNLINRQFYIEISPQTNPQLANIKSIPAIACCANSYMNINDRPIYEPLVDDLQRDNRTTPQHILSYKEWLKIHPKREDALENLIKIGNGINTILPKAPMVKYNKKFDLVKICGKGAKQKKINMNKEPYKSRFIHEMSIIKKKGYLDYFMVVLDIINYSKQFMLVGHGRGSAAGSLVCFLCGITNIDPIEYGLFFERFIDVNRFDLPDIDIDFQDDKRYMVINYIRKKYGVDNIAQVGNVSTLQAKSALIRFAKAFDIPEGVIGAIKTVSDGQSLKEIFENTDTGKEFIERVPIMENAKHVENHAIHSSVHASGVLICNEPITEYCGINTRDNKQIAMIDKKDAEHINLLKVDVLGLRTLSIVDEARILLGKPLNWMDLIPLDDKKTFKLLNKKRLTGIFQLEGEAVKRVTKKMFFNDINDICAIGALCRPGPMSSGGANSYVKRTSGDSKPKYHDSHKGVVGPTEETFGVIVYQEQVMQIARKYCRMSWEDIGALRTAISKSKQKELETFKKKFIKGAIKNGAKKDKANEVWNAIEGFGSYAFNKSHAVSYGILSYITAYIKVNHPQEFTVASMNHAKSPRDARKLLREMVKEHGVKYIFFDKNISMAEWTIQGGILYGGIESIEGIAASKAKQVLSNRKKEMPNTSGLQRLIDTPKTPFKHLYPARELYLKKDSSYKGIRVFTIKSLNDGDYCFIIGELVDKQLRDMNEPKLVNKRKGRYFEAPTSFLTITIEDDTKQIKANIWADDFEELGLEIAREGRVDKDWYLISGKYQAEWESMSVETIKKITKE